MRWRTYLQQLRFLENLVWQVWDSKAVQPQARSHQSHLQAKEHQALQHAGHRPIHRLVHNMILAGPLSAFSKTPLDHRRCPILSICQAFYLIYDQFWRVSVATRGQASERTYRNWFSSIIWITESHWTTTCHLMTVNGPRGTWSGSCHCYHHSRPCW